MDKNTKVLTDSLEQEYTVIYNRLCDELGKDMVDNINDRMDEELSLAVSKQFNNFAVYKNNIEQN